MPIASFRVVDSAEEASLHPRAIWKHWKTYILWDHRTYYGMLEFIAILVMVFGIQDFQSHPSDRQLVILLMVGTSALLLLGICPIHWYGNQRQSTHFLTRARTHLVILIFLIIAVLVSQVVSQFFTTVQDCSYNCNFTVMNTMSIFLWISIPIRNIVYFYVLSNAYLPPYLSTILVSVLRLLTVLLAVSVVWTTTRNPRKDFALAELPSPASSENHYRPAWSSANVADGIEDDSLEPEGQVRLT